MDDVFVDYLDGAGEFIAGPIDDNIVATGAYAAPSQWKAEYVALGSDTAELTWIRIDQSGRGEGSGV